MPSENRSLRGSHSLALDLLGRHVRGRAEHLAGGGHALHVDQLRDAEVGQLHAAVLVQQHVLGLDVAVDHALGVRGAERARDLDRDARRDLGRDVGMRVDELLERRAGQQLGRDEAGLGLLAAVVVDLEDRRVVQARDRQRLAREALARLLGALQVRMHDLERHPAVEARVAGSVDGGHAAVADFVDDLVLLEPFEHPGPASFPFARPGT